MAKTVDQVRRQCLALGMDADEPLAALLIGLAEGQDETKRLIEESARKIGSGSNALSPEAERELVRRASANIASETWREVVNLARDIRFGVWIGTVALALACVGVGYLLGSWRSDVEQLARTCQAGEIQTAKDGRRYCVMYLWLDPAAPAPGQGR